MPNLYFEIIYQSETSRPIKYDIQNIKDRLQRYNVEHPAKKKRCPNIRYSVSVHKEYIEVHIVCPPGFFKEEVENEYRMPFLTISVTNISPDKSRCYNLHTKAKLKL